MLYCNNCHVYIRGKKSRCVLCGSLLTEIGGSEEQADIFPEIPPEYERHLAMRLMLFISITAVVASFTVRMVFPSEVNWPLMVLLVLLSLWLSLIVIVRKRYNIPKTILWQVSIVSFLAIFWDWKTGWKGWSLDYLIPGIFMAAQFIMYITAKITKFRIDDYIFYALLGGMFGIIPVIFIIFDWVNVYYPSIICVSACIIFLSALFIFQGEKIRKKLKKRMHI